MPSYLKEVEYLPIKDINFTSARGRMRTLDDQITELVIRTNSQMGFLCLGQLEQASLFQNLRAEGRGGSRGGVIGVR